MRGIISSARMREIKSSVRMCGIKSSARMREIKSSVRMCGIKSSVRMVTSRDHSRPIRSLKKDEKYKDVVLLILLLQGDGR